MFVMESTRRNAVGIIVLSRMAALMGLECVLAHDIFRVHVQSYVLLNITKIQQPGVMPLLSNLMLHGRCPLYHGFLFKGRTLTESPEEQMMCRFW